MNNSFKAELENYQVFLQNMQKQHEETIQKAHEQLQALIAATAKDEAQTVLPAQSAWITGTDGEPFLLLNKTAAETISNLFGTLGEILKVLPAELAKAKTKR